MRKQSSNDRLTELIHNAYAIMGSVTPIKADCGKLCDKACCTEEDAGMLLFPGEEVIYSKVPGFRIENIEYMDAPGIKLLLCDGKCDRALRPLACRIFPVSPKIEKDGSVTVQPDIRARLMCPIWDLKHVDKIFIKTVEKAFVLLAEDEDMLAFIQLLSLEQHQLWRFFKK